MKRLILSIFVLLFVSTIPVRAQEVEQDADQIYAFTAQDGYIIAYGGGSAYSTPFPTGREMITAIRTGAYPVYAVNLATSEVLGQIEPHTQCVLRHVAPIRFAQTTQANYDPEGSDFKRAVMLQEEVGPLECPESTPTLNGYANMAFLFETYGAENAFPSGIGAEVVSWGNTNSVEFEPNSRTAFVLNVERVIEVNGTRTSEGTRWGVGRDTYGQRGGYCIQLSDADRIQLYGAFAYLSSDIVGLYVVDHHDAPAFSIGCNEFNYQSPSLNDVLAEFGIAPMPAE